ncbi:unnamed protein product [Lampetra fluviatilis]
MCACMSVSQTGSTHYAPTTSVVWRWWRWGSGCGCTIRGLYIGQYGGKHKHAEYQSDRRDRFVIKTPAGGAKGNVFGTFTFRAETGRTSQSHYYCLGRLEPQKPPTGATRHSGGRRVRHGVPMSSRNTSPASSPRKTPQVPIKGSPKRKVSAGAQLGLDALPGGTPKRLSVPEVSRSAPGPGSAECCSAGACRSCDTSPNFSRRWKYLSCSENHGVRTPAPEQYLTPLQQKEVAIRHLRSQLRDTQGQLDDRESEVEEMRLRMLRMREDWVDGECHRMEAQHALKDAKREIRQLKSLVDLMKSSLSGKERSVQKYFIDININQKRRLESIFHCMEVAQSTAVHGEAQAASSTPCSPKRALPRRSTYTKLSDSACVGAPCGGWQAAGGVVLVTDRAMWTGDDDYDDVDERLAVLDTGSTEGSDDVVFESLVNCREPFAIPAIAFGPAASPLSGTVVRERLSSAEMVICLERAVQTDEEIYETPGPQDVTWHTNGGAFGDDASRRSSAGHDCYHLERRGDMNTAENNSLEMGQVCQQQKWTASESISRLAESKLEAVIQKIDEVFKRESKSRHASQSDAIEKTQETKEINCNHNDRECACLTRSPLSDEKLASNDTTEEFTAPCRSYSRGTMGRSCSLNNMERSSPELRPTRPDHVCLDVNAYASALPSDSPDGGTLDSMEEDDAAAAGASSSEPTAGRAYWSRHLLLDTLAIAGPMLPAVAWLLGSNRGRGMPFFNLPGLLRGCCVLALTTLRSVPQSLLSPICHCARPKPPDVGNLEQPL